MTDTTDSGALSRDQLLQGLRDCKAELTRRYGVRRLALFGSSVRDERRNDSDIDVLVEFDGAATSERFFGVQFFLEDRFRHRIDLVTDKALRPELRPYIEREAVSV